MAEACTAAASLEKTQSPPSISYYLMKAEPDSRIMKGKDLKFSVDDFEIAQTTAWEGVRNYEARNIMQGMKIGDKVLFYHSNTKNPGIAGFAEVSKEAYPDHTAWDENHPYYDAKSDFSSPRWYMVDLRFVSRVSHFVSLSLLRHLATLSEAPEEMAYLSVEDLIAIRNMALLNKGRLSVQKLEKGAWEAISKIAKAGDGGIVIRKKSKPNTSSRTASLEVSKETRTRNSANMVVENEANPVVNKGERKRRATKQAGGTRASKRIK